MTCPEEYLHYVPQSQKDRVQVNPGIMKLAIETLLQSKDLLDCFCTLVFRTRYCGKVAVAIVKG